MDARLIAVCGTPDQFPDSPMAEVAIAGRSNCGKSSLINAVTGRTRLAHASSKPGRTRQIVFFSLQLPGATPFCLVDLPGYGFAKVSKAERGSWARLVGAYIEGRSQLRAMLLLIDIRRTPAQEELDLLEWADQRGLRPLVVLTKADKLSKNRRFAACEAARRHLELARRPIAVSVQDAQNIEALRRQLGALVVADEDGGVAAEER